MRLVVILFSCGLIISVFGGPVTKIHQSDQDPMIDKETEPTRNSSEPPAGHDSSPTQDGLVETEVHAGDSETLKKEINDSKNEIPEEPTSIFPSGPNSVKEGTLQDSRPGQSDFINAVPLAGASQAILPDQVTPMEHFGSRHEDLEKVLLGLFGGQSSVDTSGGFHTGYSAPQNHFNYPYFPDTSPTGVPGMTEVFPFYETPREDSYNNYFPETVPVMSHSVGPTFTPLVSSMKESDFAMPSNLASFLGVEKTIPPTGDQFNELVPIAISSMLPPLTDPSDNIDFGHLIPGHVDHIKPNGGEGYHPQFQTPIVIMEDDLLNDGDNQTNIDVVIVEEESDSPSQNSFETQNQPVLNPNFENTGGVSHISHIPLGGQEPHHHGSGLTFPSYPHHDHTSHGHQPPLSPGFHSALPHPTKIGGQAYDPLPHHQNFHPEINFQEFLYLHPYYNQSRPIVTTHSFFNPFRGAHPVPHQAPRPYFHGISPLELYSLSNPFHIVDYYPEVTHDYLIIRIPREHFQQNFQAQNYPPEQQRNHLGSRQHPQPVPSYVFEKVPSNNARYSSFSYDMPSSIPHRQSELPLFTPSQHGNPFNQNKIHDEKYFSYGYGSGYNQEAQQFPLKDPVKTTNLKDIEKITNPYNLW